MQVREYNLNGKVIEILKGSNLKKVSSLILINNTVLEKEIYYYYLLVWDKLFQKINYGEYPKNYTPKRSTNIMPLMPHLDKEITNLHAFLNEPS